MYAIDFSQVILLDVDPIGAKEGEGSFKKRATLQKLPSEGVNRVIKRSYIIRGTSWKPSLGSYTSVRGPDMGLPFTRELGMNLLIEVEEIS